MKKYFAVAKILFKAQIIYRFDVALTAIGTIWRVVFAWILWGAIFQNRETVGDFTLQTMLSYYVLSSFLASIDLSGGVSGEVSSRIRGGTFTKYMTIPSNPQIHFISQSFGAGAYYALFAVLAAIFCALVFNIKISFATDPLAILCALVMIPMGLGFMVSYHYFIGNLAFKFQDIGFFLHVQGNILAFLTGSVVPLALLPEGVMQALRFLPFTYVINTPAMLLTGQSTGAEGLFGLAVLAVWTAVMFAVSQFTYKRLRIKFDGVGV